MIKPHFDDGEPRESDAFADAAFKPDDLPASDTGWIFGIFALGIILLAWGFAGHFDYQAARIMECGQKAIPHDYDEKTDQCVPVGKGK